MQLNKVQSQAVNTIDKNIVLTAGAGTGKTKVLSERFLNILRSNNSIDEILAITFTKKAAAEMKDRIGKLMLESKEEILKENSKYFSNSKIFTIHGFCSEIIKRYGTEFGYNSDFQVCEEIESNELYRVALDNILNDYENNKNLFNLLLEFEYKNLISFKNNILDIHNSLRSKGISIYELRRLNEEYNNSISEVDYSKLIILLEDYNNKKCGRKFPGFYSSDETLKFFENPNMDYLPLILENLGTAKALEEERKEIKKEISNINRISEKENFIYYNLIVSFLKDVEDKYTEIKKLKNKLDYEDLQAGAIEILKSGIDLGYKFIMVDEFQDTNKLQIEILNYLTKNLTENNIFVVGDPKQSIYSFRGGDIEQFKSFTNEMLSKGAINLSMIENYRSSKELISIFNSIFSEILKDYYENLNYNIEGEEKLKVLNIVEDEILEVSSYVKKLWENTENKEEIAILFRRKKDMSNYEVTLKKLGVKVVNTSKQFSQTIEIRDVLSILRYLDNKKDYLSLLEFLKSPYVGLKENSIFEIALFLKQNKTIDSSIKDKLEKEESRKFEESLRKINLIRRKVYFTSISNILSEVYSEFRIFEIARLYSGKSSEENLEELLRLSIDYENNFNFDLGKFAEYIMALNSEDSFEREGVKLITIHKSKGLEFDHVILVDTKRSFTTNSNFNPIEVGDSGLAIKIENRDSKFKELIELENLKTIEEEKRIFYVALTRAKKTFSIVNGISKKAVKNSYWNLFEECSFSDYEELTCEKADKDNLTYELIDKKILNLEKINTNNLIRDKYNKRRKILKYYSASAYMQYKLSPQNFYKKYFLGEEIEQSFGEYSESSLDSLIRGNIIHKLAELNPVNVEEFLEEQLRFYGVKPSEDKLLELNILIENLNKTNEGEIIEKEFEFYYPVKNGIINGFIDQVREVDGKIEIIDLKTGSMSIEKIKYYNPQLKIYTKAYEEVTGKKVSSAKILFLKDKKTVNVDISESAIIETIKDFEKFIDFVEKKFNLNDC